MFVFSTRSTRARGREKLYHFERISRLFIASWKILIRRYEKWVKPANSAENCSDVIAAWKRISSSSTWSAVFLLFVEVLACLLRITLCGRVNEGIQWKARITNKSKRLVAINPLSGSFCRQSWWMCMHVMHELCKHQPHGVRKVNSVSTSLL